MPSAEQQRKPVEKSEDAYDEDVLLFVLFVLFESEHSINHGEVNKTRLHMAWDGLTKLLSAHGIDMSRYYQDPVNKMWKELDKTIFRLLCDRLIAQGRPLGRDTICLSLSPGQVKQFKDGNKEISTIIGEYRKEIVLLYNKAPQPNFTRVSD